jgi:hypothetical protein
MFSELSYASQSSYNLHSKARHLLPIPAVTVLLFDFWNTLHLQIHWLGGKLTPCTTFRLIQAGESIPFIT